MMGGKADDDGGYYESAEWKAKVAAAVQRKLDKVDIMGKKNNRIITLLFEPQARIHHKYFSTSMRQFLHSLHLHISID